MPDLRSAEPGDASAPHDVPGHPTGPRGPGPMRSLLAAAWSALARGAGDALRARGLGAEAADPLRDRIRVAQFAEIKKQIPALYACLTANAVAVAFTHARLAPPWLTVGVLALLVPICIGRGIHWYRLDAGRVDAAEAAARMRRTVVLTAFLSLAFVVWAVMLDGYGGPFERGHVALFVAITVIACIFCLMHLPACALLVTAIVTAVFLAHYLTTGNAVFGAISLNLAFVVMVMVRVLRANYDSFLKLIHSQAALIRKQEEMRLLAEENFRLAHTDASRGCRTGATSSRPSTACATGRTGRSWPWRSSTSTTSSPSTTATGIRPATASSPRPAAAWGASRGRPSGWPVSAATSSAP